MSREVLGTLPDDALPGPRPAGPGPAGAGLAGPGFVRPELAGPGLAEATSTPVPEVAAPTRTRRLRARLRVLSSRRLGRPGRRRRRRRAAVLSFAVLVGTLAGWCGDAAWRSAQATDALLRTAGLSVVVIDAEHTGDGPTTLTADLTVRLTNLGLVPVELSGAETTYDAAAVVALDPPHVSVPVHAQRSAVLEVAVGCRSPQPLDLPPLQVQTPDGALSSVLADGAGQVLADLCNAALPADRLVRPLEVSRVATQLRVVVTACSGRTTELQAIRAGGVPLLGRPLPATVDGEARTLWLDRPPDCPQAWRRSGFPESLEADVDVGSQATVTIPLGYQLTAWLLDGPCGGIR